MKTYNVIFANGTIESYESYKEGLKATKGAKVRFSSFDDETKEVKVYFDRREVAAPAPSLVDLNQPSSPAPSTSTDEEEQPAPSLIADEQPAPSLVVAEHPAPSTSTDEEEQPAPSFVVDEQPAKRDLTKAEKAALRKVGNDLQKDFESAKGFSRALSNEMYVFGVFSPYFEKIYKAYLGLHYDIKIEKGLKGEERKAAKVAADRAKGAYICSEYAKRDTKTLENSIIFRVLSNVNLTFGFLRANLVRFYSGNSGNCVVMAKRTKVADFAANLKPEEKAVLLQTKKSYLINGSEYIMSEKAYNDIFLPLNGVIRKEVREDFGEVVEQPALFFDEKSNISALVPKTKFTFADLVPVLCRVSLRAKNKYEQPLNQTSSPAPLVADEQPAPSTDEKKGEDVCTREDFTNFAPFTIVEQPAPSLVADEQPAPSTVEQPAPAPSGTLKRAKGLLKRIFAA